MARLLILQSMFSVDGVWPQIPSCLGMQLKVWLVCKHPSHLGMQLKDPVYKKCVHLRKSYVSLPFPVAALAVSLSRRKNGTKLKNFLKGV